MKLYKNVELKYLSYKIISHERSKQISHDLAACIRARCREQEGSSIHFNMNEVDNGSRWPANLAQAG